LIEIPRNSLNLGVKIEGSTISVINEVNLLFLFEVNVDRFEDGSVVLFVSGDSVVEGIRAVFVRDGNEVLHSVLGNVFFSVYDIGLITISVDDDVISGICSGISVGVGVLVSSVGIDGNEVLAAFGGNVLVVVSVSREHDGLENLSVRRDGISRISVVIVSASAGGVSVVVEGAKYVVPSEGGIGVVHVILRVFSSDVSTAGSDVTI
jgi:hypothetical protein